MSLSIFGEIARRDAKALDVALQNGDVSVHDVRGESGKSAMHYLVCYRKLDVEIIKLLIAHGADLYDESDLGISVIQIAMAWMVSKTTPPETRRALETFFPWSVCFERYCFPTLHKIILGQHQQPLATALQDPAIRSDMNLADDLGRTALYWAAASGNESVVRTLISAGATVDVSSLMAACQSNAPECTRTLLDADPTGNLAGARSMQTTPIHHAARYGDSTILSLLLSHGAHVNALDYWASTPLQSAAEHDNVAAMNYLFAHGADVNGKDWEGDTPLSEAIYGHAHNAVLWLLEHGADLGVKKSNGESILHMVAKYGSVKMTRSLIGAKFTGLDPETKDNRGRTAQDIASSRRYMRSNGEFQKVFEELIESVSMAWSSGENDQEFEEKLDDQFLDALESQIE